MKLFYRFLAYSFKNKKSMCWLVLSLSICFFMLQVFAGEKLREEPVNMVTISCDFSETQLYFDREILDSLMEMGGVAANGFSIYPIGVDVNGTDVSGNIYSYYPDSYSYFSEDEETQGKNIILGDFVGDGVEISVGGLVFESRLRLNSITYQIPYWSMLKLHPQVYGIIIEFKNITISELIKYERLLRKKFPYAKVNNSEVGVEAQNNRRTEILYIMITMLSVINIMYIYWYFMKKKKNILHIYYYYGCNRRKRLFLMLCEILVYYAMAVLVSLLLYLVTYNGIYEIGLVSYMHLPEAKLIAMSYAIIGIIVFLFFGVLSCCMNRKIENI